MSGGGSTRVPCGGQVGLDFGLDQQTVAIGIHFVERYPRLAVRRVSVVIVDGSGIGLGRGSSGD